MADVTLLVVDDSKPNREMLARRLKREGYEVITAEGGREALDLVSQLRPSMVLLDLMMPEMSGIEVLEELRKSQGPLELPVLMVSANTDSPQMVASLDVGANDYLTKPVDFDLLLAKVRRHLNLSTSIRPDSSTLSPPPPRPALVTAPPEPGELLGHFRLGAKLGEGGMGQVFLAEDVQLLRQVAIKVMLGEGLSQSFLDRFILEARAVARVSHPGVVTIFEIATEPRYYIAMELLKGKPLPEVCDGKPLEPGRAIHFLKQMLDALQTVHDAGVTHRDLKPSNIMVDDNDRVKILDFGLAKLEGCNMQLTKTGEVWGTPRYMAPEQIDPDLGTLDGQTDLFAISAIFYEMLTGQAPFQGKSLSKLVYEILSKEPVAPDKLNPQVPPEVSRLCLKGLRKAKADRPKTCREFLKEFERVHA